MKFQILFSLLLGLFLTQSAFSQNAEPYFKKHFVGSNLFMVMNLTKDPPKYYQLNYGYRITPKDVVSVEAITWTYKGPLGRPLGPDYDNPDSNFPGTVQAFGAGLAYKRFIWKGVYGKFHSTALHQNYLDEENGKIQSGFQLFNTLRFGYHFEFFKNRVFLEPSIAATFWPVNTNLPDSFQVEEDKWPSYFLFEPGLHFGINF